MLVDDDRGGRVQALDVDEPGLDPGLRHEGFHLVRQIDELGWMVVSGSRMVVCRNVELRASVSIVASSTRRIGAGSS